ncbi:MAG: hypothetical protein JWQ43_3666 [Glaciihabitans sp.]|nr:hypothetical protein [Glaciihabitans sp.]
MGPSVAITMMNFQDVVDELANTLGRSVIMGDPNHRLIAASSQGKDIDHMRAMNVIQREAPPEQKEYFETIKLNDAHQPVTVTLRHLGGLERLAVPVRDSRTHLATFWLILENLPPLRGMDFAAIEAAVSVTRDLLGPKDAEREPGTSDDIMGCLLSPDSGERRQAFDEAVARRRLERGEHTIVYAVDMPVEVGTLDRLSYARHLSATRTSSLAYIGERKELLLFVGRSSDTADSAALIRKEAALRSITVSAIGTAHHNRLSPDILEAANQAEMAAGIVRAVPQLAGLGDISALGVWALLASIGGDRSYLQVFSPAAFVLCTEGDEIQRHTIETYLDGACHVGVVCEQLHIHRATLYYRLDRMPQAVKDALDDGAQRSALHMCLKLIRLWESTGRI